MSHRARPRSRDDWLARHPARAAADPGQRDARPGAGADRDHDVRHGDRRRDRPGAGQYGVRRACGRRASLFDPDRRWRRSGPRRDCRRPRRARRSAGRTSAARRSAPDARKLARAGRRRRRPAAAGDRRCRSCGGRQSCSRRPRRHRRRPRRALHRPPRQPVAIARRAWRDDLARVRNRGADRARDGRSGRAGGARRAQHPPRDDRGDARHRGDR